MPKSSAERKAEQRARQAAAGVRKLEIVLDEQEMAMLEQNCTARRPGREPYEMAEYIALLIRQDDARVRSRIKSMSKRQCGKCGDCLPVQDCPLKEESACWVSQGWHETKLVIAP
ncbi:hypothetical protein [Pantoea ananatis]|uniref:hypothetical protein n=1 Tax=Pantoea ananas TaxID=553 RepID=UPI003F9C9CDF